MAAIDVAAFRELLQTELLRLLREHPESRHELWGLMLESFDVSSLCFGLE